MTKTKTVDFDTLWLSFQKRQQLSDAQLAQFKLYYQLLKDTNELHNLTAITELSSVITDHFDDSLALQHYTDMNQLKTLADIGTGAGFPAIPLRIKYPHLSLVLIEVNHKKREFLQDVITQLYLDGCTIEDMDWRTFIRQTNYAVDIFCARASLQPEELVRMFKPSSPYKQAELVYWASIHWEPTQQVAAFIKREEQYMVGAKKRKLIFMAYSEHTHE